MPSPADYRFCPCCGGKLAPRVLKEGEPFRLVCAACAVGMVDGGIVLARRGIEPELGKWVCPGGFVERGEAVTAAAVRETQEEVNLKVTLLGILDAYSFPGSDIVVIVYAADVVGGTPKACDECQEVRTFAPEALPWDELAFPSTRAALRDYLRRFFPRVRVPR